MIRKVSFRNFKAYRSLDLELEPFTVLVGPNASGKTTLLEGLELLCRGARGFAGSDTAMQTHSSSQSFGASSLPELTMSGNWGETAGTVRLREVVERISSGMEMEEQWGFSVSGEWSGREFPLAGVRSSQPEVDAVFQPSLAQFRAALGATMLRFEPRRLSEVSYSEDAVPRVHSDGSGLASVLAHLKLSQDEVFGEIELALKQVVPTVRRIRIERAQVERTVTRNLILDDQRQIVSERRTMWGHQLVFDMRGAKGVPASTAGEGTLMALGLLAVLLGPGRPKLVLLDDIEMALHPVAQEQLIGVLRRIQARDPELQIIATSHSPFILNFLKPEEIRITSLAENGAARCVPMTSHPDFERWKGLMTPGEFWSTVGESWMHNAEAPSGQGESAPHE